MLKGLKVGDRVKWMGPLDYDYFYGKVVDIRGNFATIRGIGLHKHAYAEVHFKYITKVSGGSSSGSGKRDN